MLNIKRKYILNFLPILALFIFFLIWYLIGKKERNHFYVSQINSKIINSADPQLRVVEYYLKNNVQIDVMAGEDVNLQVGDSILKKANSVKYSVYKKNAKGAYYFYKSYTYWR